VASRSFAFGPYRLSSTQKILLRRGTVVPLTPKAIEILLVLVERAGEVVGKDEVFRRVWPGTTVVEANLTQTIFILRKALAAPGDATTYIETIPKLGYRFVAPVHTFEEAAAGDADRPMAVSAAPAAPLRSRAVAALVIAGIAALGGAGWGAWRARAKPVPPAGAARIRSIAVLPLANLSGDPSQQYFADGMTDELITMLTELHMLDVTSRTSSAQYRNTTRPLPQIARELGVDAVVEGAVASAGGRVRINAQLIDARSDRHLWAASYERPVADALVIQADIAREIARQIQVQLSPAEDARLHRRPLDPGAQQEYLLGRYTWNRRNPADLAQAVEHFQRAAAIDPRYAEAFAGLADAYAVLPIYNSTSARSAMARAKAAAEEALRLDPALAEAHTSLAHVLEYEWDFAGAEREYRRAIALKPAYALAHQWYAEFLRLMNREGEAIAESAVSMRLDPLSPLIAVEAALPYYYRGDYDEAVRRLRRAIQMDPAFGAAYGNLGWVLEQQGKYAEALDAFDQANRHGLEGSPWIMGGTGWAYARSGDTARARDQLARLERLARTSDEPAAQVALVLVALGREDEALRWYERAFRQHDWWMLTIGVDPKLSPVRDSAPFQRLMTEIGLP
jgi:TolB-like protein/DNA-binding winged helix-turn-helix (wHTH) protein/Tfp pilus assembly protein PilF